MMKSECKLISTRLLGIHSLQELSSLDQNHLRSCEDCSHLLQAHLDARQVGIILTNKRDLHPEISSEVYFQHLQRRFHTRQKHSFNWLHLSWTWKVSVGFSILFLFWWGTSHSFFPTQKDKQILVIGKKKTEKMLTHVKQNNLEDPFSIQDKISVLEEMVFQLKKQLKLPEQLNNTEENNFYDDQISIFSKKDPILESLPGSLSLLSKLVSDNDSSETNQSFNGGSQ